MVQAILRDANPKTQTRRTIPQQPTQKGICSDGTEYNEAPYWTWRPKNGKGKCLGTTEEILKQTMVALCPYGKPGDRLWVRETWRVNDRDWDDDWLRLGYRANPEPETTNSEEYTKVWSGRISIPHEKWPDQFNRKTDRAVNKWRPSILMPRWASRITLEVLNIRVERLQDISEDDARAEGVEELKPGLFKTYNCKEGFTTTAKMAYSTLWDEINGVGSWDKNPWVWVIEFRRVKP